MLNSWWQRHSDRRPSGPRRWSLQVMRMLRLLYRNSPWRIHRCQSLPSSCLVAWAFLSLRDIIGFTDKCPCLRGRFDQFKTVEQVDMLDLCIHHILPPANNFSKPFYEADLNLTIVEYRRFVYLSNDVIWCEAPGASSRACLSASFLNESTCQ